jgi:hemolysin III
MLALIWSLAVVGIAVTGFWVRCPKWFSSVVYIAMGWTCVLAFTQIINSLPNAAFQWLLAGGIIYTVGGIIYALKLPIFNSRHRYFGSHEIFHLFCMAGSFCHFMLMYQYIAVMP